MKYRNLEQRWPIRLKLGLSGLVGFVLVLALAQGFSWWGGPVAWLSARALEAPTSFRWLGFALYGQPVSELILDGAVAVFFFGVISVLISVGIAMALGFGLATSARDSWPHQSLAYLLDVFGAVPGFLLSAVVLYAGGASLWSLVVAFSVANWDSSTRLAWSVGNLVVGRSAYMADKALGYDAGRLFWFHYFPETFGPLSAKFCSLLAYFVVFGASAVVIGILDPQLFAWGALLNQGRQYFDVAPHVFWVGWFLVFCSTFFLTMISSGIHLLFEGKIPR